LGSAVGALENAILAADTLVIEVMNDPGDTVFCICVDRAPICASRLQAVVTRTRYRLENRVSLRSASEQTNASPDLLRVEAVHGMACCNARFAAETAIEIDLERVLLPFAGRRGRNQLPKGSGTVVEQVVMNAREGLDRGRFDSGRKLIARFQSSDQVPFEMFY